MENCWVTARQIEAGRIAINRYIKRGGKLWIRLFPYKPVTSKPIEVRMGKGKGDPEFWVDVVKRGRIIFELEGVTEELAKEAMRLAQGKFAVKTRFVKREK
jgi:large subunit ribosomal protein L16